MKKWEIFLFLLIAHLHATDETSHDSIVRTHSGVTIAELDMIRTELEKDIKAEQALERTLRKIQNKLSMASNETNRTNN